MEKIHFNSEFLDTRHPFTILLIGTGGTGSQVLHGLARINCALKKLGRAGIHVTAVDPDLVTESNMARQLFTKNDIGRPKADVLIERVNRFFSTAWESKSIKFDDGVTFKSPTGINSTIYITCVDNLQTRSFVNYVTTANKKYWMDFGNGQHYGQAILGGYTKEKNNLIINTNEGKKTNVQKIPYITDLYKLKETTDQGPSCSLAEALSKQDLFINSILAYHGCNILWNLLYRGFITHHGFFLNLKDLSLASIPVDHQKKQNEQISSSKSKKRG